MKPLFIVILIAFGILYTTAAQDTYSEYWKTLSHEQKALLLQGFMYAIEGTPSFFEELGRAGEDLPAVTRRKMAEILKKVVDYFRSESIDYWLSSIDTYYLKKDRENAPLYAVIWLILYKTMNNTE